MATEVKRRRGTTSEHASFTGAVAELTVDLTKDTVVVHDGATQGGFPLLREDFSNVPTTAPFTHITLDTAIFDTTYTETGSETQGTLYWNSDEETLSLVTNGESIELGQKVEIHVKNQTGAQINKGEVVYASGTVGASGRILVTKMIADGTVAAKRVLGVAAENIANGADGKVIKFGKLRQINTSTFSDGDILWVSTTVAGGFQNTEPSQSAGDIALPIAYVVYSSASVGEIFIRVTPIDENEYQDYDAGLQDIAGLTPTDSNIIVGDGTNWVAESGATARASLGLTIGTHVQAWDAQLDTLSGLSANQATAIVAVTDTEYQQLQNIDSVTISNTQWGYLGALDQALATGDSPTFAGLTVDGLVVEDEVRTLQSDVIENHLEIESLQDNKVEKGQLFPDGDEQALGTGDNVTFNALTANGATDLNSTLNVQGVLTTQNNVLDDGFSSGWSGTNWQIQANGSAELQELRVRGALRVYEFIAKQISTIGGSEILSIAQGRVESAGSGEIVIDNVDGSTATSFSSGDLWIVQTVDINTGTVTTVRGLVDSVANNVLTVTVESGSLADLEQGDLIVGYGSTSNADRQAIMYRNVDRSEDNLIMRLQTGVNEFSKLQAEANTRVAFGDLNGYSGLSSETFGFFAGNNSASHILATSNGLFLKDGSTTLAQLTSNTFKVGDSTNFLSFDGTTFDIQTDTFNLDTTNLDISSANENIVIGTGSALMTVGKLSSVEQGIKIDSSGITNQNYWKLGQGNVQFKVGDGTNFLSFNENAGTFEIETQAFRLDTTASGGGIDIDSTSQTIKLEDSNKVRTVIDVNSGGYTLTETTHHNAGLNTIVTQTTTPYETSVFAIDEGDSLYVDVEARLSYTGSGTPDPSPSFYIEGQIYGGTSGTATNLVANFLGTDCVSINDLSRVTFSAFNYSYTHYKVKIVVNGNNTGNDARFTLTSNLLFRSADSRSRFGLDGLYIDSSNEQYARLTREENKLAGITKLVNIPSTKPIEPNVVYKDSNGFLKIS